MKAFLLYIIAIVIIMLQGCGKQFLNIKKDQNQITPMSILEFDAILNAIASIYSPHTLGAIGGEEFISSDPRLLTFSGPNAFMREAYVWADDIYGDYTGSGPDNDWATPFSRIYYANLALDGLKNIKPSIKEEKLYNEVRGRGLFMRGMNYFALSQQYCAPYDISTAATLPGLPLRLESDVTIVSRRATLENTYQQILADLEEAVGLLPEVQVHANYISRAAGHALLSRVYLNMGKNELAAAHADSCLIRKPELIDLNQVLEPVTTSNPFKLDNTLPNRGNPEVLYYETSYSAPILSATNSTVDPKLIDLFDQNDLRKSYYFYTHTNGNIVYRGSYSASSTLYFTGISNSEVYLNLAEACARMNQLPEAVEAVNMIRLHRFDKNAYTPLTFSNKTLALEEIYKERRRELIRRGTRWSDLRRFNKDADHQVIIRREAFGKHYTLDPGSQRYVWPIPYEEIWATGMEQNLR